MAYASLMVSSEAVAQHSVQEAKAPSKGRSSPNSCNNVARFVRAGMASR